MLNVSSFPLYAFYSLNSFERLICYLFILPNSPYYSIQWSSARLSYPPLISVEYYNILLNADILSLHQNLPIFALTCQCCLCSGEEAKYNFIRFGLTRPGIDLTFFSTRGAGKALHHCKQAAQCFFFIIVVIIYGIWPWNWRFRNDICNRQITSTCYILRIIA